MFNSGDLEMCQEKLFTFDTEGKCPFRTSAILEFPRYDVSCYEEARVRIATGSQASLSYTYFKMAMVYFDISDRFIDKNVA